MHQVFFFLKFIQERKIQKFSTFEFGKVLYKNAFGIFLLFYSDYKHIQVLRYFVLYMYVPEPPIGKVMLIKLFLLTRMACLLFLAVRNK